MSKANNPSTQSGTNPAPLPYSPPKGPKGQEHVGPGLGDKNHGQCGTQGKR